MRPTTIVTNKVISNGKINHSDRPGEYLSEMSDGSWGFTAEEKRENCENRPGYDKKKWLNN